MLQGGSGVIGNRTVYSISHMRRGSKRIADKCMKLLDGVPLVSHTLGKLNKVGYIDKVCVSTSDDEYAQFVYDCHGAYVVNRPERLSGDTVHHIEVINHAVRNLDLAGNDYIVFVDITKPFTKMETIKKVIVTAHKHNADTVFTSKKIRNKTIGVFADAMNWGAVRLYRVSSLLNYEGDEYGRGFNHYDLPIIEDYETDLDFPHDWIMTEALIGAGYETSR